MNNTKQRCYSPKVRDLTSAGVYGILDEIGEMQDSSALVNDAKQGFSVLEYYSPNLAPISNSRSSRFQYYLDYKAQNRKQSVLPDRAPQHAGTQQPQSNNVASNELYALRQENQLLKEQILCLSRMNLYLQQNYDRLLRQSLGADLKFQ